MCCAQRSVEPGLVAAIDRSEINGLCRRIQFLLAFGFAVFISCDNRLGSENLRAEECGIRVRCGRMNDQFAVKELRFGIALRYDAGGYQDNGNRYADGDRQSARPQSSEWPPRSQDHR